MPNSEVMSLVWWAYTGKPEDNHVNGPDDLRIAGKICDKEPNKQVLNQCEEQKFIFMFLDERKNAVHV